MRFFPKSQALHRKFTSALSAFLFMILHPRVDGAGAVDLFGEDKAGQLVGHRDAAHAEPERRRALDLVREAVGRADDEGHISRAAVCAVGEELGQLLGGDLFFSLDAQGDDGRALRTLPRMALPSLSSAFFTTASEAFFSSIFSSGSSTMRKDANAARRFWYSATPSAKYFALSLPMQIRSIFCMVIFSFLALQRRPSLGELAGASPTESKGRCQTALTLR